MTDGSQIAMQDEHLRAHLGLADVDPTTGLRFEGATPFNTSSVSPIEDAIDIPYTVIIPDLTSEAADYRVTAHVTASITDIDTAPTDSRPRSRSFAEPRDRAWLETTSRSTQKPEDDSDEPEDG